MLRSHFLRTVALRVVATSVPPHVGDVTLGQHLHVRAADQAASISRGAACISRCRRPISTIPEPVRHRASPCPTHVRARNPARNPRHKRKLRGPSIGRVMSLTGLKMPHALERLQLAHACKSMQGGGRPEKPARTSPPACVPTRAPCAAAPSSSRPLPSPSQAPANVPRSDIARAKAGMALAGVATTLDGLLLSKKRRVPDARATRQSSK